jgi:PPOX class probable F420-dependent enzyme
MPMYTMTHEQAMEFLAVGARTGKVATASPDAKVHVAPLWFVVDGQDLVFVTTATSVKGRHLHANPRAALCVDDDTYPCAFVTVRGPVVLEDQATDLLVWTTLIARRYVPDRADQYAVRNDAPGETLVRLRAQHVIGCGDVLI